MKYINEDELIVKILGQTLGILAGTSSQYFLITHNDEKYLREYVVNYGFDIRGILSMEFFTSFSISFIYFLSIY